uniref:Peptidase S9 prolyl oligopeptidase catalytic domain-containing protein n=1 Tax=Oryza punctata TaxID=4537 RepID=A0A0E0LN52_ORYPU
MGMVGWLKALCYGAGGMAVVGLAALVALQERLVYVPVLPGIARAYPITPDRLRLIYEDVWLRAADGVRLHSWSNYSVLPRKCWQYGESDGYPSQKGITDDAQAALDHLVQRKDIDTSRIVVFGRSLGGAVGAVLAKNNPGKVSALILENTFTSILDMAGLMLPFLRWFIGGSSSKGPKLLNCVVRSPWSTLDIIAEVKQPIIFLSGLQDELVPPSHMRLLYEKAFEHNKNCRFVDFPNGMHMDTWNSGGDRYWRTIQLFLDQYAPEVQSCNPSCKSESANDDEAEE